MDRDIDSRPSFLSFLYIKWSLIIPSILITWFINLKKHSTHVWYSCIKRRSCVLTNIMDGEEYICSWMVPSLLKFIYHLIVRTPKANLCNRYINSKCNYDKNLNEAVQTRMKIKLPKNFLKLSTKLLVNAKSYIKKTYHRTTAT